VRKLLSSVNFAEVGLLKSIFEQEGIACVIRNEQIGIASGGVPFTDCYPELWVLHDEDFDKAQGLLAQWRDPEIHYLEPWICARCGEENEGQFGACWYCGEMIDEEAQL
jgi:hypothetical protein